MKRICQVRPLVPISAFEQIVDLGNQYTHPSDLVLGCNKRQRSWYRLWIFHVLDTATLPKLLRSTMTPSCVHPQIWTQLWCWHSLNCVMVLFELFLESVPFARADNWPMLENPVMQELECRPCPFGLVLPFERRLVD